MKAILYDWFGWNQQLLLALNGFDAPVLDTIARVLGIAGDYRSFPLYVAVGLFLVWKEQRAGQAPRAQELRWALWSFSLGYAIGVVLIGDLKVALDFPRPSAVFGPQAIHLLPGSEPRYSLPSGHAAFAALLATSLWPLSGTRMRSALVLFALAVGWSRVWSGIHFPADVVAGYGCGLAAGWLAQRLFRIAEQDRVAGLALFGALAVFVLDQASKSAVVLALPLHDTVAVTDFFNLVYWQNTGAAFGLLSRESGWQSPLFMIIGIAASYVLVRLIRSVRSMAMEKAAFALILGGALGNVFDRVVRGAVVDWLDFHWGNAHWPAFNLADAGISVGAVLLLFLAFRRHPAAEAPHRP